MAFAGHRQICFYWSRIANALSYEQHLISLVHDKS
jgi:hypothetical protein